MLTVLFGVTLLVPRETAAVSARSVYAIQPCTCHVRWVYARLAVTCHLHFWQNNWNLVHAAGVTRGRGRVECMDTKIRVSTES